MWPYAKGNWEKAIGTFLEAVYLFIFSFLFFFCVKPKMRVFHVGYGMAYLWLIVHVEDSLFFSLGKNVLCHHYFFLSLHLAISILSELSEKDSNRVELLGVVEALQRFSFLLPCVCDHNSQGYIIDIWHKKIIIIIIKPWFVFIVALISWLQ